MRLIAALAPLAICCGEEPAPIVDTRPVVAEFSTTLNRDLDLLVVADDSGATADMKEIVGTSFSAFLGRLSGSIPGGLPSLHIGIATSDLGTATSTSPPAPPIGTVGQGGCADDGRGGVMTIGSSTAVSGNFLTDIELADGTRQRNYTGELGDVFHDMVRVGAVGCGFEQPLASMRAALDGNPANAGFRRDGAVLAILFVMDEDDCSVRDPALFAPDAPENPQQSFRCTRFGVTCLYGGNTPDEMNMPGPKGSCTPNPDPMALLDNVGTFRNFILDLVHDPRHIVTGGLIADVEPFVVEIRAINSTLTPALQASCRVQGELGGDPGVRLDSFIESFPHSSVDTMCQTDYSTSLEAFADQVAFAMGTPCVSGTLADSDAALDGLQPDCILEDHVLDQTIVIPSCESSGAPCWQLETDAATCPLFDHFKVSVTRNAAPDPATVTQLRCARP